jgi:hypothetical protein
MIAIILVALILGVVGAVVFERLRKTDGEPENTAAIPAPPDKPAILADPVGAFDDKGTPPVEVAYIHFLDEAHRLTKGNIRVGSPTSTPTRIEVRVTAQNARPETVVVLEKFNNGRQATVIVGPKDAGAVRSYTLTLGPATAGPSSPSRIWMVDFSRTAHLHHTHENKLIADAGLRDDGLHCQRAAATARLPRPAKVCVRTHRTRRMDH